jgi:hypothetical protein
VRWGEVSPITKIEHGSVCWMALARRLRRGREGARWTCNQPEIPISKVRSPSLSPSPWALGSRLQREHCGAVLAGAATCERRELAWWVSSCTELERSEAAESHGQWGGARAGRTRVSGKPWSAARNNAVVQVRVRGRRSMSATEGGEGSLRRGAVLRGSVVLLCSEVWRRGTLRLP